VIWLAGFGSRIEIGIEPRDAVQMDHFEGPRIAEVQRPEISTMPPSLREVDSRSWRR